VEEDLRCPFMYISALLVEEEVCVFAFVYPRHRKETIWASIRRISGALSCIISALLVKEDLRYPLMYYISFTDGGRSQVPFHVLYHLYWRRRISGDPSCIM
jgi:hypothetical protein